VEFPVSVEALIVGAGSSVSRRGRIDFFKWHQGAMGRFFIDPENGLIFPVWRRLGNGYAGRQKKHDGCGNENPVLIHGRSP
jgi:hypothetical protein